MSPATQEPPAKTESPAATAGKSARRGSKIGRRAILGIRRRSRRSVRGQLIEVGKTMLWVVPLTLLIWVWAQDQQIDERTAGNVRLQLVHRDAGMSVRVLEPSRAIEGQADTLTTSLTLRGPRVGLNRLLRDLRDGEMRMREVPIATQRGDRVPVDLQAAIGTAPILAEMLQSAGVSIVEVSPATAVLSVEGMASQRTGLTLSPRILQQLSAEPVFEPSGVVFNGPRSAIEQLGLESDVPLELIFDGEINGGERKLMLPIPLSEAAIDAGVTVEPGAVEVTVRGKAEQVDEYEIPAITVYVDKPAATEQSREIVVEPIRIANVRVRGPKNIIDLIRDGDTETLAQVRAVLVLGPDDFLLSDEATRAVEVRLPAGVELLGDPPSVTFRVSNRGDTQ
ncbi:MAG: hypothetical protein AAGK78_08040 [Planctomycetota bacterium]